MGNSHRSICVAGTPPPRTGRSVAASSHPAQLPLHRVSIPGYWRRVTRFATGLRAFRGLWGHPTAILALLSLRSLPSAAGVAVTWIFSLWGTADLLNAFYQANHAGLLAGQLGAAYFIPTLIVPLLLITHGLVFRILVQHQAEPALHESQHAA